MYAKLNPGVGYVQGMNELLGPIYYVFATDPRVEWRAHAEADAFFCFTQLMSEVMNNFIKTLDHSAVGVKGHMATLNRLLRTKDPQLWAHLEHLKIDPQFYSFRWLTLLLSQEFELPDVLRLWDTLLADAQRFSHLHYVCIAMMIAVRDTLLAADFATALRLLQAYPPSSMDSLLELARQVAQPAFRASHEEEGEEEDGDDHSGEGRRRRGRQQRVDEVVEVRADDGDDGGSGFSAFFG